MRLRRINKPLPSRAVLNDGGDLERIQHGSICFDLYTLSSTASAVRIFREAIRWAP